MKALMIEDELSLSDESEARRQHERYQCHGIQISYSLFSSRSILAVNENNHQATVNDISLTGLSIELQQSLTVGDLLSIEIQNPDSLENELLTAEIMWCKSSGGEQYNAGLQVIGADSHTHDSANDDDLHDVSQNQLICPSCNEVSFYLKEIKSDNSKPELHHCCRCGHSHQITDVMAFNRQL